MLTSHTSIVKIFLVFFKISFRMSWINLIWDRKVKVKANIEWTVDEMKLLLWTHFIGSKLADYSLYWIFAVVMKLNIETFSGWIFKVPGRRNFTYASLKQQIRFQTMWIILYNTIQLYATNYPDRVLVEWIQNPWFFS